MTTLSRLVAAVALALAPLAAISAKETAAPTFPACLDSVTAASGEPKGRFDRGPARPGDASGWYAVDRRDNGCPVLVKLGDPSDVRPANPVMKPTGEDRRAAASR